MDIVSGGFYIVKDEFFDYVNDPNLLRNHEDGPRPHFLAFRDDKTGLLLMIPCTSKVEKYKEISKHYDNMIENCKTLAQKEEYEKKKCGFRFYNIAGRDNVVVFEKMFFISDEFIARAFYCNKVPAILSPEEYKSFCEQATIVLNMLKSGYKFVKHQPKLKKIERLMLKQNFNGN